MDIREKLKAIPYSYDDFVQFAMQCIEEVEGVKEAIIEQFRINPNSDTNDITQIIYNYLEINDPVDLVDDEETFCESEELSTLTALS